MNTKILHGLLALIAVLSAPKLLHAQETLLGIGWIHSSGAVIGGWSPVGTISTSRPNTGEFHITINAPGEFTGAGIGDFLPQATTRIGAASDRALTGEVISVSDDAVTAVFYLSDIEDSANPSGPEPVNYSFQFALLRFPAGTSAVPAASRYLLATGSIASNGTLKRAATSDGSNLEVNRVGEGDYHLTLSKTGAYAGFGLEDFYPFATSGNQSNVQDNLPVGTADSKSNDHVLIQFRTADVQNASNDNPEAEDDEFHFTIYRAGGPSPATAESSLLLAMASVQGNNGLLRRSAISLPGANLAVERTGSGRYRFTLSAPGRFAGKSMEDFAMQVHLNNSAHIDRIPSVRGMILGADTFEFDVRINDVENVGEAFGVAEDNDFFLTIHDAVPTSKPDLRIGKKPSLTKMKGNNLYNSNARGQKILTSPSSSGLARIHLATENDGNVTQDIRTRGKRGAGLSKTRCFQMTGGKKNVTAAFLAGGTTATSVRPGQVVRYEVRTVLPADSAKIKTALRFQAGASPLDRAVARIARKP